MSAEEVEAGLSAVLAVPSAKARREGAQQFRSGRRAESHFLWASELAALKSLLRSPELLRRAIGGPDQWGHLDGRMLLALARVVASAGADAPAAGAKLALDLATASGWRWLEKGTRRTSCGVGRRRFGSRGIWGACWVPERGAPAPTGASSE